MYYILLSSNTMRLKTTVKVISLYDLIENNIFIIFTILHHIIILIFNQYAIEYTNYLKLDFPEKQKVFEEIHINLEFCQTITLFTLIILYLAPHFTYIFNKTKVTLRQIRFVIMTISFLIKMIFTVNQLYHNYDNELYKITNNEIDKFIIIIMLSYTFRITFLAIIIIILLLASIMIFIKKFMPDLNNFAKNYKLTYIEHKLIDETYDV